VCLLLVGPSEQCERSEPASLRVAGGDEPERERGEGEGVSVRVLWVDLSYTFNVYVRLVSSMYYFSTICAGARARPRYPLLTSWRFL
jgi:hypothetical protein